jgi:hypothetical protein
MKQEGPTIESFDAAVEAELARVSHIEYDSHEICKHFASKLRKRLEPLLRSCAERYVRWLMAASLPRTLNPVLTSLQSVPVLLRLYRELH